MSWFDSPDLPEIYPKQEHIQSAYEHQQQLQLKEFYRNLTESDKAFLKALKIST